jgi:hypothetical protein
MRQISSEFVRRLFTDEQKQRRVYVCQALFNTETTKTYSRGL